MIQELIMLVAMTSAIDESFTPAASSVAAAPHTYEARIRLKGRVSTTQVKAVDAGHAKRLVQAQYGPSVTVLSVKKVD